MTFVLSRLVVVHTLVSIAVVMSAWKMANSAESRSQALASGGQNVAAAAPPGCRVIDQVIKLRDLPEASGVAASRRMRGVFWAHNDSGQPLLFALNEQGAVTARVRVAGSEVDDWEDIAVGPCPEGSCVYIADIGDNSGKRDRITIYRAPEPSPQEASTRPAEVFHARYPDGAHDAEALFVAANSDMFIITKGDPGPIALYRFPGPLRSGAPMQLERIGEPVDSASARSGAGREGPRERRARRGAGVPAFQEIDAKDRPTAADVSPDGQWVAVRTTHRVVFYRAADLTSGRWREAFRTDVSSLKEPRGEGITFGANGTVILVGEGGFSGPGTFARLFCTGLTPGSR